MTQNPLQSIFLMLDSQIPIDEIEKRLSMASREEIQYLVSTIEKQDESSVQFCPVLSKMSIKSGEVFKLDMRGILIEDRSDFDIELYLKDRLSEKPTIPPTIMLMGGRTITPNTEFEDLFVLYYNDLGFLSGHAGYVLVDPKSKTVVAEHYTSVA